VVVALGLSALVAGCTPASGNRQNSFAPKGDSANKIFGLFWPVAIVAVVIGVLVIAATVFFALRFRYRPGRNENPRQTHGNTKLEIAWTIAPAVILMIVAVPTVSTIFKLAKDPGPSALQISVVGKQWWWQFDYKDEGIVTADELVIPAGRTVELHLTACDASLPGKCNVIHSFWVPELAGKRDVVPGHDNRMTIEASKPGVFLGQCAEYCGLSHANMRFRVIAKTADAYDRWVGEQQNGPVQALAGADGTPAGTAQALIAKYGCTGCHVLDDSGKSSYGPNLTHLASRSTFASGNYTLNRSNLIRWLLDAPSMIPMQSKDCRLGVGVTGVTCVGMPSFTKDTPDGQPVMTRDDAAEIANYLLGQR
jgi:cytochrome c oxidase subunit 2